MPLNRLDDGTWVFDYSTLSTFADCRRKGNLMFVEDLRLPTGKISPKIGFGQAYHSALAEYYRGKSMKEVIHAGLKTAAEYNLPLSMDEDPARSAEALVESLKRYVQFHAGEPYQTVVIDGVPLVEQTHRMMLTNDPPIAYAFKIDVVVQHIHRKTIHPMDHKTTGRIHDYTSSIRPNAQFTGYLAGTVETFGLSAESAILNAIWVAAELKTKKRPLDEWFARAETSRNEVDFDEWHKDMVYYATEFIRLVESKGHFAKNTKQCHIYDGCIFRDLCGQNDDPTVKAGLYIKRAWSLLGDDE